jgi:hypothetical protein
MTRNRFTQIGLDRLVRLAWLEKVSSLVLAGNDSASIKSILQSNLQGAFRSTNTDVRGSIDKTITILLKIWLTVPNELEPLRVEGLELLKILPRHDHLVVHWGMVMAVYPFWSNVAIQVGRLLRLQGVVAASQVQRRIREQYGERETVSRRARYALRSYLDWGVLQETDQKGVYSTGTALAVNDSRLIAWLVEASLLARANSTAPLKDLTDSPSLFPFRLAHISAEHVASLLPRLNILRHGLDDDLVMLLEEHRKKPKTNKLGNSGSS